MTCSNTDTILLYGLTFEERKAVDIANRYTNYQCFEAQCVADLLAVPHLALVVDPAGLSKTDWIELMEYYCQAPEDGAKAFFTRPMFVPPDVTAPFHFPNEITDLQWRLTGYLYRHAVKYGDRWGGRGNVRQMLRNCAKQYQYIFFLCYPGDTELLTDLCVVAEETHHLLACTEKQSYSYRRDKLHQAARELMSAIRETGKVTFRFDLEPALICGDDLLPLMAEKGFFMPMQINGDTLPILNRFNNSGSLLLYSLDFLDAAAGIANWWQGEIAWGGVSIQSLSIPSSRKEIFQ